ADRWIEELILRLRRNGFLDDAAYARGLARSLHRRGKSARAIEGKLREKGVEAAQIETALRELEEDKPNSEFRAAVAFARRRRLGPFRETQARAERRTRDLAALGRQGFSYALARRVIEAEDAEELEAMLANEAEV
ncbi:MAG: regulatory protein RecX, partial [Pseudomonadota bacterium]